MEEMGSRPNAMFVHPVWAGMYVAGSQCLVQGMPCKGMDFRLGKYYMVLTFNWQCCRKTMSEVIQWNHTLLVVS